MFLLAIISTMAAYVFFFYSFNLMDPENRINQTLRPVILAVPGLRILFRLHQYGDARFDYAKSENFSKIVINIYHLPGKSLTEGVMDLVINEMKRVVVKPAGIEVGKITQIPLRNNTYEDVTLKNILKIYPADRSRKNGVAALNIFLLDEYAEVPTYAGLVINDDAIFLFMDSLKDISGSQLSTKKAEMSTILHEFGHLLGAEHANSPDCIMSEVVEDSSFGILPARISESYCDSDMQVIREALGEI